jgi:hypothetical protein
MYSLHTIYLWHNITGKNTQAPVADVMYAAVKIKNH